MQTLSGAQVSGWREALCAAAGQAHPREGTEVPLGLCLPSNRPGSAEKTGSHATPLTMLLLLPTAGN